MEFLRSLCLTFVILCRCTAIDIDDILLTNCTIGLNCNDPINTDLETLLYSTGTNNAVSEGVDSENMAKQFTTENAINTNNGTTDTEQQTTDKAPSMESTSTGDGLTSSTTEPPIDLDNDIHSNICPCDLTMSTCDINCCCDADCNDFQLSGFANHSYHQRKMYDARYCYTRNFIHRNSTKFILESLASNLFCIAYDNLPPIYGIKESLDIRDRKSFEDARTAMNPKKYSWGWNKLDIPQGINISTQYDHSDRIWKVKNNKMTLIELPQSGFTSQCKFGKTLKYQESASKWKCMQTNLSNDNEYLFSEAYDDFLVVSPSHFSNLTFFIAQNHTCPDSICVPVQAFYCLDSWRICNITKAPKQSCEEGVCQNVIKRVRYEIALNGTCGLRSVNVLYEITNTSKSFYQYFEVTFEKASHWPLEKSLVSRDSPTGYTVGSPIITGTPVQNDINNVLTKYINVTNSTYYLTLPMRQLNGDCHSRERYIVGFGEDIRLKCSVQFTTDRFSSDSCATLQNQLFDIYFEYLSQNTTEPDKFNTYVSKTGGILERGILNWTEILFDKVARNVVTGQTYDNRIRCSGLLTSVNINILYTMQPKPQDFDNYKIEGISVTFDEPFDISWPKCAEPKCNNNLKIDLLSLVSFTDISTKSMYYYASGPNLDITLPYDFFYPFMNYGSNAKPTYLTIKLLVIAFLIT